MFIFFNVTICFGQEIVIEKVDSSEANIDASYSSREDNIKSLSLQLTRSRKSEYLVLEKDVVISYDQFLVNNKLNKYNNNCISIYKNEDIGNSKSPKIIIYISECDKK
jgi:hypothetical protein